MKNKLVWLWILIVVGIGSGCEGEKQGYLTLNAPPYLLRDARMVQVSSHDTTGGNNDRINIHVGDTARIFDVTGPGMISRIWFTIDSRDPDHLRNIILTMYWDDEEQPSVWSPVGDFFGSPFEYRHFQSENIGMTSGGYYCYFPMPFNTSARIEVINQTSQEVFAFYYHINYYQTGERFPDNAGYFHALWQRELRTRQDDNYVALNAVGKGQFVGLHYSGQAYNKSLVFLEGDEMIYVDNELTPSTYGTGMEDYFNSGWYFRNGEFSAPYHGLVILDRENARVSAYRHHIRDAIPFDDSVRVTFEHGHDNEEFADIATTAFWYQQEPHNAFDVEENAGLRNVLKRAVPEGVIEAEQFHDRDDDFSVTDMTQHGSDWSDGRQLLINTSAGQTYTLHLPLVAEKAADVDLYFSQGPGYGNLNVNAGGKTIAFSGYSDQTVPAEPVRITSVPVRNGEVAVSIRAPEGGLAGLDAIQLTPVRSYIPEWYIIGPFDSQRKSDFERPGIDIVYGPEVGEVDLNNNYGKVDGPEIMWQPLDGSPGGYGLRLWDLFEPSEFIICYALTYIYSPDERTVPLLFSSDDGSKVFLNDEELYRFPEVNIARPDEFTIDLPLKKGWNKLMLKLENNFGGYAFYSRIRDDDLIIDRDGPNATK